MSIPVDLTALEQLVATLGSEALLITVADHSRPHVVSVLASWTDHAITMGAGRRSAHNVGARPDVTLMWTAPHDEHYRLIVDGTAHTTESGRIIVTPTTAVLHRIAGSGDPDIPTCLPVG
ncbi:MAG: pyridoxamine 5'-phosphate oxidase family protein [Acidimicrobiia bacterium]|nr:pyridoxamine 5'-phosphate oxidase family protein [Acidimicrobiia bacterium]